jgi:hypothetical protein
VTCAGGTVTGQLCNGGGLCQGSTAGCGLYKCDAGGIACLASCGTDADCVAGGAYCDTATSKCKDKGAPGAACTRGAECAAPGYCYDGVCCNQACGGQCEACNVAPNVGSCVPVSGDPAGSRKACAGTGPCRSQCNGGDRTTCFFPGAGTPCGAASCVNDTLSPAPTCDGSGVCQTPVSKDCGDYACDPTTLACKTSCTTKADCRLGGVCDTSAATGTCNVAGSSCQGAYNVKAPDGTVSSCNGYRCVSGACQQQCGTTADCATGYSCAASSCVADAVAGSGGAPGAGGASPTGGQTGSAGSGASAGTGAATGAGGTTSGTGGASATNTGGVTGPDAGAAAAKGAAGDAGSATSKDAGGCGCRVPKGRGGRETPTGVAGLALAVAILSRRRSRGNRADARRRGSPRHPSERT